MKAMVTKNAMDRILSVTKNGIIVRDLPDRHAMASDNSAFVFNNFDDLCSHLKSIMVED